MKLTSIESRASLINSLDAKFYPNVSQLDKALCLRRAVKERPWQSAEDITSDPGQRHYHAARSPPSPPTAL